MRKRAISLTLALIITSMPIANAHTVLVSSNPKSNAMLTASPKYISITFNEELIAIAGKQVSKISLFNAKGKEIKLPPAQVIHKDIVVAVSNLPASKYIVKYRVVSADGHPVSGSFNFWVH
jgi:copper resistance protein C